GDCDTNAEIAAQLNLSPATVKSHVEDLLRKLQVPSRHRALVRALRLGLITVGDLTLRPKAEKNPPNGG
ncbi:MAG: LuxR C-terminal-related transcriptional regulator, partial [Abditibacteriales bacterium]|nr:LuxR C-terminal-related transcriptional regulator [Abditibacteriales bacterium]